MIFNNYKWQGYYSNELRSFDKCYICCAIIQATIDSQYQSYGYGVRLAVTFMRQKRFNATIS